MKISVDLDDVLSNSIEALRVYSNKHLQFKLPDTLSPIWQNWEKEYGPDVRDSLYRFFFTKEFLDTIQPCSKAQKILPTLTSLGVTMSIMTSRTSRIHEHTRNWLDVHFAGLFSDIIFLHDNNLVKTKDKGQLCTERGIVLHIDDNPLHAQEMRENNVKTILLDKPWNKDFPECSLVTRAMDWEDILEIVKKIRE